MAEFDRFSESYKEILDRSLKIAGCRAEFFAEYKARYACRFLAKNFRGKILDYGCGVGLLSNFLKKYFPRSILHGYDTSGASIEKIDGSLSDHGIFTTQSGQLDHDYELILASNVLHHINVEDHQATFEEFRKRLSSGGKLLVFEHNPLNPFTRWIVNHCPLDRHAVLLPAKKIQNLMRLAKLKTLRLDYIFFFPSFLGWLIPLEPLISWCPLGAQYVIAGRKNY